MKMEAARSSKTLVSYNNTTWHHSTEDTENIFGPVTLLPFLKYMYILTLSIKKKDKVKNKQELTTAQYIETFCSHCEHLCSHSANAYYSEP
jgi:hypothetical protein